MPANFCCYNTTADPCTVLGRGETITMTVEVSVMTLLKPKQFHFESGVVIVVCIYQDSTTVYIPNDEETH